MPAEPPPENTRIHPLMAPGVASAPAAPTGKLLKGVMRTLAQQPASAGAEAPLQ